MSPKAAPGGKPDMTIGDVADHYGVTKKTVRNMIADGRLRAYRLGPRIIRFRLNEVEAALTPTDAA
jgi:excisionase family DNA binding protein